MLTIGILGAYALSAALGAVTAPAAPDVVWFADRSRSNVTLSASQLLVAKVKGTIPISSATIVTTDHTVVPIVVDVMLDSAAMTTNNAQRDADLRSDRFFDVARYPTITFASSRVVGADPSFKVDGDLTMRGVTHPIEFDARVAQVTSGPGGAQHIRYEATGHFKRTDYGMVALRAFVGNDVTLRVVIDASTRMAR